jgi:hypothetical protein
LKAINRRVKQIILEFKRNKKVSKKSNTNYLKIFNNEKQNKMKFKDKKINLKKE